MTPERQKELRQLARDTIENKVFFATDVPADLLPVVFLPLALAAPEILDQIMAAKPKVLFGYLSDALPRQVNGFPTFGTFYYLTEEEYAFFDDLYRKMLAALEGV